MKAWQPISEAPQDGSEIIGRDAGGGLYLVAWLTRDDARAVYPSYANPEDSPDGWYQRAGGNWDMASVDGHYQLQEVTDLVLWTRIPGIDAVQS